MQLLDGKLVSAAVKEEIKQQAILHKNNGGKQPHLAAILVGNNGASETYVASKVKNCSDVGFKSSLVRLEENVSETELLATIEQLNTNADVDGILVQLPLPKRIHEEKIINAISPEKDVDGFHPVNIGKLGIGLAFFYSGYAFWHHAFAQALHY